MTTVTIQYRRALFGIAIAALLVMPACYTLFKHPRLAELNYRRPSNDQCTSCHASEELAAMIHSRGRRTLDEPWKSYYQNAWWFDQRHAPPPDSTGTRTSAETDSSGVVH